MLHAVTRKIARVAARSYGTAKVYRHLAMRLERLRDLDAPIVVFQMGKVGSTSVVHGLRAHLGNRPVYHIHYLTDGFLSTVERINRESYNPSRPLGPRPHWESQYLRRLIDKRVGNKPWKIITLVREPVGRNISSFFENLKIAPLSNGNFKVDAPIYGINAVINSNDVTPLSELFLRQFDHDTPLVFFDREFKGVLNIDLLAHPFPHSKGYAVARTEHFEVLVLRLEQLSGCAEAAMREFLGIDGFEVPAKNIGEEKSHGELYRAFRDAVRLPQSYVNLMYGSRYARHFYTTEEIQNLRDRHLHATVPQAEGWGENQMKRFAPAGSAT